jgi:ATP-dependent DNA ligase
MLQQVLPMLAMAAQPFDSPEYCFEIKYDGVRALAAVDEAGWRLWGRERADYTTRRPGAHDHVVVTSGQRLGGHKVFQSCCLD